MKSLPKHRDKLGIEAYCILSRRDPSDQKLMEIMPPSQTEQNNVIII